MCWDKHWKVKQTGFKNAAFVMISSCFFNLLLNQEIYMEITDLLCKWGLGLKAT